MSQSAPFGSPIFSLSLSVFHFPHFVLYQFLFLDQENDIHHTITRSICEIIWYRVRATPVKILNLIFDEHFYVCS